MKCWLGLPSCVLLLCALTAFVSSQSGKTETSGKLIIDEVSDGIKLSCTGNVNVKSPDSKYEKEMILKYKDENSGEYMCDLKDSDKTSQIFVKFRTCDNCIELDVLSIVGMVVGNVVATAVICWSVYVVALVVPTHPAASNDKTFDRKQPGPQDPYQRLKFKSPKDVYDELDNRR